MYSPPPALGDTRETGRSIAHRHLRKSITYFLGLQGSRWLDHCILMRQVHRKAIKSGQRRLNFLPCKTTENDDVGRNEYCEQVSMAARNV